MDHLVSHFALLFRHRTMTFAGIPLLLGALLNPSESWCGSQIHRVRMEIDVTGALKFNPDGKGVQTQPLKAYGEISYDQLRQNKGQENYVARYYRHAEGVANIGKSQMRRALRPTRRTMGVARGETGLSFCPSDGPLTGDELDVIETQFDPIFLVELTAWDRFRVGATSKPTNTLLASLLLVDVVHKSDVETEIVEIDASTATISIKGSLSAAAEGVSSEITIAGLLQFALDSKQITRVAVTIAEKRAIGHAAPGFDLTATLKATLTPVPESPYLSAQTVAMLGKQLENNVSLVSYASRALGLQLLHDRRWKVLVDRPDALILRRVDHGDLIGQCNVSRLENLPAGEQDSLETFQADVKKALAENFEEIKAASTSATDEGLSVLRVQVQGKSSELAVCWVYYLVTHPDGRRVSLVFTFASELAAQFADADRALVSRLQFASPEPESRSTEGPPQAAAASANTENR